jgi:hypothetical protein
MKYATWKLNFTNPEYGTGPEDSITLQGGTAEGSYANGDVTQGAEILGYYTGTPTALSAWSFKKLTQAKSLEFVQGINPEAYLGEDGTILVPITDPII